MTSSLRSALFLALVCAALPAAARGQTASYTTAQAEAGAQAYTTSACVACHMPDLSGGEGPPLQGSAFTANWDGGSVSALFSFLKENMPATAPGSLSDETYLSLVAYLLSVNGAPAGASPLTTGSSAAISFGK